MIWFSRCFGVVRISHLFSFLCCAFCFVCLRSFCVLYVILPVSLDCPFVIACVSGLPMRDCSCLWIVHALLPQIFPLERLCKYAIYILLLITEIVLENKTILINKGNYKKNQYKCNINENKKP